MNIKDEYLLKDYKDMNVIVTNHAIWQAMDRSVITMEEWVAWFKRIIDFLEEYPLRERETILVYSDRLGQGVVLEYRKDGKTSLLSFIIITVLPRYHSTPKPGTEKHLIEKKHIQFLQDTSINGLSENCVSYIKQVTDHMKEEEGTTWVMIGGKYYDYYNDIRFKEIK